MTNTIKSNDLVCYHLNQCNEQLEKQLQSQIITIRSPIYRGLDDVVRTEIESTVEKTQSKNKMLPKLTVILETTGGSIEVVERISNVFRKHFHEVDYIVPGYAYSAGTVLALSGDNIYMDYYSVLGPIDPQIEQDGKFVPGRDIFTCMKILLKKAKIIL
ncbi:MAG: ATP-dependent Clp protease proteolytic subunit [Gammaproteobacteria bacterium]|jgi:ClpP class serine protease